MKREGVDVYIRQLNALDGTGAKIQPFPFCLVAFAFEAVLIFCYHQTCVADCMKNRSVDCQELPLQAARNHMALPPCFFLVCKSS